jgi:hypothetical protein
MAERESDASNPLLADFILVGERLERLGFIYAKGELIVLR